MRLIDYEALEKDAAPKTWELITEGKYFKAYAYLVDALNDAPTINAVPIRPLCECLAGYAAPPKYALEMFPESEQCLANTRAAAWEHHIRTLIECGLIGGDQ